MSTLLHALHFVPHDFTLPQSGDIEVECPHCHAKACSISVEQPHAYQCWKCKATGNGYTLLNAFYDSLSLPSEKQTDVLLAFKPGFTKEAVEYAELRVQSLPFAQTSSSSKSPSGNAAAATKKYAPALGCIWWFPVRNNEGKLVALYHFSESLRSWISTPKPFSQTLLGLQHLKPNGTIYKAEGHWDYLALLSWFRHNPVDNLIATAGSAWPSKSLSLLKGRKFVDLGDNDDAAVEGRSHLAAKLKASSGLPEDFKYLDWSSIKVPGFASPISSEPGPSPNFPSGFDLRDLACLLTTGSSNCSPLFPDPASTKANTARMKFLKAALKPIDWESVTTVKANNSCRTWESVLDVFRTAEPRLTVTKSFEDCLAIALAVHVSIRIDGDPLWIYLVGAPSSGKSTLIQLLAADERHTIELSKFTGVVTGDRHGSHLAPRLNGRCLLVKDGTMLLESGKDELRRIFGELRDIFDGSLAVDYRNGREANFKGIHFSQVMGMTEAIYGMNTSILGERFLHCRLEVDRDTEVNRNRSAIEQVLSASKPAVTDGNEEGDSRTFPVQRSAVAGFLQHVHSHIRDNEILRPAFDSEAVEAIQAMADCIACCRAHNEDEMFDARPESSTRVVKLLARLALCLCYIFDRKSIDQSILDLLRKVCLDSCWGQQFRILSCLARCESGINKQSLAVAVNIPLETMTRRLKSMTRMGMVNIELEDERVGRGRRNHVLRIAPWIAAAFKYLAVSRTPLNRKSAAPSTSQKKPPALLPSREKDDASLRKTGTPAPAPRKPAGKGTAGPAASSVPSRPSAGRKAPPKPKR